MGLCGIFGCWLRFSLQPVWEVSRQRQGERSAEVGGRNVVLWLSCWFLRLFCGSKRNSASKNQTVGRKYLRLSHLSFWVGELLLNSPNLWFGWNLVRLWCEYFCFGTKVRTRRPQTTKHSLKLRFALYKPNKPKLYILTCIFLQIFSYVTFRDRNTQRAQE